MTGTITRVLGDEYDPAVRTALTETLSGLGAVSHELLSGVAGSQELQSIEVSIDGRALMVEVETYVGLSVTGDEDLVLRIVNEVERRLRATDNTGEDV